MRLFCIMLITFIAGLCIGMGVSESDERIRKYPYIMGITVLIILALAYAYIMFHPIDLLK